MRKSFWQNKSFHFKVTGRVKDKGGGTMVEHMTHKLRIKGSNHRFERITRYNLGLASIGNYLETVSSYANNS